jgi:hypothetical protein
MFRDAYALTTASAVPFLLCFHSSSAFSPGAKMFASPVTGEERQPMCESCHKMSLGPCATCQQPLRTGKFVELQHDGSLHHSQCLTCSECRKLLGVRDVRRSDDGRLFCETHYLALLSRPSAAPVVPCAKCGRGIGEDDGVTALDQNWHAACFVCAESGCTVDIASEGRYYELEKMPFCTQHYMLRMGKPCARCGKQVPADVVTSALGQHFHPECLKCSQCSNVFPPGSKMFVASAPSSGGSSGGEGSATAQAPLCESCHDANSGTCTACGEPLRSGKYASVLGRKYHATGCVSCIACLKRFAKGDPMFQRDGFPVCKEHASGPLPPGAEENMRRAGPATGGAAAARAN